MAASLKIGERIEVRRKNKNAWFVERIIETCTKYIKTKDIYGRIQTMTKPLTDRVSYLNNHTISMLELAAPPKSCFYSTKPIFHTATNSILICMHYDGLNYAIYQYLIKSNQYKKLAQFTVNAHVRFTQSLDEENQILWILYYNKIIRFNLKTLKLKQLSGNFVFGSYSVQSVHIPSPINQFHIIYNKKQWKRVKNGNLSCVRDYHYVFKDIIDIIFVKSLNCLILIDYDETKQWFPSMDIHIAYLNNNNPDAYMFRHFYEFRIKDKRYFQHVLAFGHILFVFEDGNIFALDLLHKRSFSYDGNKSLLYLFMKPIHAVKTINNDIHIFPRNGGVTGVKYQFKFSLYDVIPSGLRQFYLKYYNALIFGYMREYQQKETLSHYFPVYLTEWILSHFPLFL